MKSLNENEKIVLQSVALKLGVKIDHLYALINFESGWNPLAQNPMSSAKGLIQITDSSARALGYKDSWNMIEKNPTIETQLKNCVYPYLRKYAPYKTEQSLYMAVFYPKAMYWPELKSFPDSVTRVNPNIKNPLDYIKMVYKKMATTYASSFIIFLIAGTTALLIFSKKI